MLTGYHKDLGKLFSPINIESFVAYVVGYGLEMTTGKVIRSVCRRQVCPWDAQHSL